MSEPSSPLAPAVPFLRFDSDGGAFLQGSLCTECGAVAPGDRRVCGACGSRRAMSPMKLGERGKLYSYTIVHRSFPGVKTPFIAVIVDLEGGGALKGTLLDVAPNPEAIAYDMPMRVIYRESGQTDAEGRSFLSYYFVPEGASPE